MAYTLCKDLTDQKILRQLDPYSNFPLEANLDLIRIQIATARCARVSYLNFEGKDDYEADIKLYEQLLASGHMSPFEHCARAMDEVEYNENFTETCVPHWFGGDDKIIREGGISGNFKGWVQLRKTIQGENKKDERVKH
jgi:hypothetical protein